MLIQSKKVWIADQFIAAELEIENGKITEVLPYGSKPADKDYGDLRIVPGFMDIHCHGAFGFDTNDANEEGLRNWTKNIVTEGVTSFLATTITQSEEVLTNAVANVARSWTRVTKALKFSASILRDRTWIWFTRELSRSNTS